MGIFTRHIRVPDLWHYEPEYYADGTEKHISLDGARYHVLSFHSTGEDGQCRTTCSAPKCEYNLTERERIGLIVDSVCAELDAGKTIPKLAPATTKEK